MRLSKLSILGCLFGASFFVACQSQADEATATPQENTSQEVVEAEKEKKGGLQMRETTELAALMQEMYEENLALRKSIMEGDIPESFPEDWLTIHTAEASEELNEAFDALAKEYINNVQAITKATTKEEGIKAYNQMVATCASCHNIYCQGPLVKIKKMTIPGGENL